MDFNKVDKYKVTVKTGNFTIGDFIREDSIINISRNQFGRWDVNSISDDKKAAVILYCMSCPIYLAIEKAN